MTDIEDRLRDAFAALDEQTVVPPMRVTRRNQWRTSALAVGATAAAFVLVVTVWSLMQAEHLDTAVRSDETPAEFDLAASRICREAWSSMAGSSPQFATADAYRIAARSRIDTIDAARRSLVHLPNSSDGARVKDRVGNLLDQARATAAIVVDHADNGYVQTAGTAWRGVDRYIDAAFRILGDHGAEGCAR
jgi:hypothetical protein